MYEKDIVDCWRGACRTVCGLDGGGAGTSGDFGVCAAVGTAQSVMAEGGINAALDTKGEGDTPQQHEADTLRAACGRQIRRRCTD